ncbi:unnamed protein product [Strongylus vulgaris]|uniref:Uncharacterized protein n=1 Tax=Strongylus vulgaris TaxID=40348 RepID=A0A3P7JBZ4_STRVU|nr:unnamed protein product [Strongylus vulgaris]
MSSKLRSRCGILICLLAIADFVVAAYLVAQNATFKVSMVSLHYMFKLGWDSQLA